MAQPNEQVHDAGSTVPPACGVPEIHAHEGYRRYKLIDLKNNEIERTAAEIVEGSTLLGNKELWAANFRLTLARVREWCESRSDALRAALVDIRSNKIMFYFVPESDRYDLDLGDQMTALEVDLSSTAGIDYVETLQVPERSLDRFVSRRGHLVWSKQR